jgi:hypothetical protein
MGKKSLLVFNHQKTIKNMKLILIHGRAQGKRKEEDVKKEWIDSLQIGLDKSGYSLPLEEIIAFPFYGKQLDDWIEEAKNEKVNANAVNSERSSRSVINEAELIAYYESILSEIAYKTDMTPTERVEMHAFEEQRRGPLNWAFIQKLMVYLDNKKILNDLIVKTITEDVYMYLNDRTIRKRVNDLVKAVIPNEPCVVVGILWVQLLVICCSKTAQN